MKCKRWRPPVNIPGKNQLILLRCRHRVQTSRRIPTSLDLTTNASHGVHRAIRVEAFTRQCRNRRTCRPLYNPRNSPGMVDTKVNYDLPSDIANNFSLKLMKCPDWLNRRGQQCSDGSAVNVYLLRRAGWSCKPDIKACIAALAQVNRVPQGWTIPTLPPAIGDFDLNTAIGILDFQLSNRHWRSGL